MRHKPAGSSCGLVANPSHMSSKVSIIGSGGTFNVGRFDATLSPPIDPLDSRPQLRRDIYSDFPATATFSFTADAGGVTPITLVDNGAFSDSAAPPTLLGQIWYSISTPTRPRRR